MSGHSAAHPSVVATQPGIAPAILTVGFGTTVAMWGAGYVGRLPLVMLPSPVLLFVLLVTLCAGGVFFGRHTGVGFRGGAGMGLLIGVLNLMILGSFLSGDNPNQVVPSALAWLPGSIVVSALLAGVGAWFGAAHLIKDDPFQAWLAGFARVAVGATFLLLAVGGLVTSVEAGLAVTDWPNSFGYNMFLYPFSRMTGPVYYEHAHRLFGALVGLTTLVLALFLQRAEPRRWVRITGWLALIMVVIQGILGGLRVTGTFTLSTSPEAMTPSVALAMIHGVFGQIFFAILVALAVFTSPSWRGSAEPLRRHGVRTDRIMGVGLVALMLCQLLLGASQRHFEKLLIIHIVTGIALVTPLLIHVAIRAWGLNRGQPILERLGLALMAAIIVQIVLGFAAYATSGLALTLNVTLSTAHQWCGALLLALGVATMCWNFKLLAVAGDAPGLNPAFDSETAAPPADPRSEPASGLRSR